MAAELIDGKALAATLRAQVKEKAEVLRKRRGRPAALHVVLVGDDPASQVYVRNKEKAAEQVGFLGQVHRLPAQTPEGMLFGLIDQLNASPDVDGILVQLPLPGHLDATRVVDRIDPRKDVDGLHPVNAGLLLAGRDGLRPCTPSGCMHMLDAIGCKLGGKRALVVGRSILVGKPIALMLLERNATVVIAHSRTADLREEVSRAEVVIAAVGRPELIKGDWIQPGAVVVDVGINRQEDGTLRGDVEFARAAERASWITPVPGGVGPMTIAKLLENTLRAVDLRAP